MHERILIVTQARAGADATKTGYEASRLLGRYPIRGMYEDRDWSDSRQRTSIFRNLVMQAIEPNLSLITHMLMALVLGWAIGYERFFHARASGSQIYCLVSVASCALTQVMGYSAQWFGGDAHLGDVSPASVI